MKSLLKNVLRRISKKQSSKEDNATAFYPDCYSRTSESVRRRIEMSYDNDVRDTISSLRILAGEMASGFVEFKNSKREGIAMIHMLILPCMHLNFFMLHLYCNFCY